MRLPRDLHIQLLRLIPFRHVPALLRVSRYFRDLASAADLERLRRQDYRAMPWKERRPPGACAAEWDEVVRAQERVPAWRIRSRPDSKAARRRSKDRADRLLQDEPYLPLAQWEQRLMGMTLVAEDQVGDETVRRCSVVCFWLGGWVLGPGAFGSNRPRGRCQLWRVLGSLVAAGEVLT